MSDKQTKLHSNVAVTSVSAPTEKTWVRERLDSGDPRSVQSKSRYRLPFILSGLYRRYRDARDVREKYAYAIAFAEGVFRFFAYVNVANVIAVEGASDQTLKSLQSLLHGSIGRFVQVNQWAYKTLKSSSGQLFCHELDELFRSDAWKRAQGDIPALRNRYAHGSLVVSDDDKYRELEPYIIELTRHIQWLNDYRLGVFTDGRYHRRSQTYLGDWRLSAGLEEDAEPIKIKADGQGEPPAWDQVLLLSPDCRQALSLSPLIYRANPHGVYQYFWLEKFSARKDQFVYRHPHLTDIEIKAQPIFDLERLTPAEYEENYPDFHRCDALSLSPDSIRLIRSPHDLESFEHTYEIIGKVGEGGMGVVYKVYHKVYERRLALKILKSESSKRQIDLDRFKREAKLLHRLEHASIVKMSTLQKEGEVYYLEMEFIEGGSLKSYLDQTPHPPLDLALNWFKQILEAVRYIHGQGIIHRDLKPSNVMISGDVIKLIDFGIAKHQENDLTRTGTQSVLGTELFMAPEQWENQATHLSDLYSCGLLLGTLLGHPPRVPNRPPRLRQSDTLPETLRAAYLKATSLDESQRFQSASDFLDVVSDIRLEMEEAPVIEQAVEEVGETSAIEQVMEEVEAEVLSEDSLSVQASSKNGLSDASVEQLKLEVPRTQRGYHASRPEELAVLESKELEQSPPSPPLQVGDRISNDVEGVRFYERVIPAPPGGEPFLIMETQVTQALYEAVIGQNPSKFKGSNLPVEHVSWEDGIAFCNALSERLGLTPAYRGTDNNCQLIEGADGFRLPFEAEWEFATRGGQSFEYAGSDKIDEVAWHYGNSGSKTHPVGQKKANGYGLYDMSGNVWEWGADNYRNPGQHRPGASWRAYRGGGWSSNADFCRASYRSIISPDYRSKGIGLRLSRSLG